MEIRLYREDLLKLMVAHAADSYKEVVRVAALIEDKAQKTAALAGVFLAAGFGFIKEENLSPTSALGSFPTLVLLTVAIVLLISTVMVCLWVLWVREQAAPIRLALFRRMVLDIARLPDSSITEELQDGSRLQLTHWWTEILDKQESTNLKKASGVRLAQALLTFSIVLVALSLLLVLLTTIGERIIKFFAG